MVEQLHVLAHLLVILGSLASELEIDHNGLVAVGHHAVGASLGHAASLGVEGKDGTLVEELPAPWLEPFGHAATGQSLAQQLQQLVARGQRGGIFVGFVTVAQHAVLLHLPQHVVHVVGTVDVREYVVQQTARLYVGGAPLALVVGVVGIGQTELSALVALSEVDLRGEHADVHLDGKALLQEGVSLLAHLRALRGFACDRATVAEDDGMALVVIAGECCSRQLWLYLRQHLLDECRARLLSALPLAIDKQTLCGAREGHVEQVHVVYQVLLVLLVVVALKDGSLHALLAEVYGHDGQLVEGCLGGRAPQHVGQFEGPVAERHEHARELQALRLVDGDEAQPIHHGALDGLLEQLFVPQPQEGFHIRAVVGHEVGHLVVEGT